MATLYKWKDPDVVGATAKLLTDGGALAVDEACCCVEPDPPPAGNCEVCHPCLSVYIDVGSYGACLSVMSYDVSNDCYNKLSSGSSAFKLKVDGVYTGNTATPLILWVRGRMYMYLTLYISGSNYYSQWAIANVLDDPPDDCLTLATSLTNMRCTLPGGDGTVIIGAIHTQSNGPFCDSSKSQGLGVSNAFNVSGMGNPTYSCGIPYSSYVNRASGSTTYWDNNDNPDWRIYLRAVSTPPCHYELVITCNAPPAVLSTWMRFTLHDCGGPEGTYIFDKQSGPLPNPTFQPVVY